MNENKKKYISKNIIINSFNCNDNFIEINAKDDNNKYFMMVKDGSVKTQIVNSNKQIVGLRYLEDGDMIKIKGFENSNKIIIKKIYIETKYTFDSESSEDLEMY